MSGNSESESSEASSTPGRRHRWVLDVLEEDSASVEVDGREARSVPRWLLPSDVREGDVLAVVHERDGERSRITIARDAEATRAAYAKSAAQVQQTGSRSPTDPGGNITL